ncbi:MAG: bifunctional 2-polyprenyl-6-hydroxyphenol methylase/3-demethylubiquinol 3-O-methyltransferase UbiG [Pseudomonadota bacterium]
MHSVDEAEIQNFSKDSSHWWDENGPFKPLHRLNPVRLEYIKGQICDHFSLDFENRHALKGLKILDIGCGGGLVCEPMARMGADITGVDADANAIEVANAHADEMGLNVTYINGAAEDLNEKYDVVLALEVIEHVIDMRGFVNTCMGLCKPDGLVIFSTLNRTAKSFALGIVAAEYILRWVPQGTHSWKKFVKPSELSRAIRSSDGSIKDISGLIYNPITDEFSMSETDIDVNYFITVKN